MVSINRFFLRYPLKKIILSFILLGIFEQNHAQTSDSPLNNKGKIYFYWGYNRSYFSKSDIHFKGPDYNFTLYDVEAHDRPAEFDPNVYLNILKLTIPQFNIRTGYFVSENIGISLGYDHMKYIVDQHQDVKINGTISGDASKKYAGTYNNDTIGLAYDFLTYEHSDGLNLVTLDFEYSGKLFETKTKKFNTEFTGGIGGIWVAPRTDARVFEKGSNNDYHVAGYSLSLKTGLRFNFFNKIFFLAQCRGGYMTLPSVLLEIRKPQRASQNFYFFEYFGAIGTYFRIGK